MKTVRHQSTLIRPAAWITTVVSLATAMPGLSSGFAPAGPEFQVHTTTTGAQSNPDVAMDSAGNAIVVWFSAGPTLESSGGFAQRLDSNGSPLGTEFRFGDSHSVSGSGISVAMAPDGRFVIVYNNLSEIIAKRYDAAGNELPPPLGIPQEVGNAFYVKSGPPFAAAGPSRYKPKVAMDANANFIITWEDRTGQDGDEFGVFAKRYDAAGNELAPPPGVQGAGIGNEFQVNTFTGSRQMTPDVAMKDTGGFIITWWSFLQDGNFDAVMAKRYDAAGNELAPATGTQGAGVGNEFQVNSFKQEWAPLLPGGAGHPPHVAMDAGGIFVISWDGSPGGAGLVGSQDCSSGGVFAKRYDVSGNELSPPTGVQGNGIGNEFQVNSRGPLGQGPHDVAITPDGQFVFSWYGYAGQTTARVISKAYTASGQIISPSVGSQGNGLCNEFEATTFTAEGFPAVAMDPTGNFIIAWDDSTGTDGDGSGIFARRYIRVAGPTPISPLTNEPALECPPDITVNVDGLGQAIVPDLRSQAVITGVCAPCASVTLTQNPAPGTMVTCGAYPITLTLSDTVGHSTSCTTMFNVVNPASAVNVVLKVVDQHGQEIPGSTIQVLSQAVNTGESILIPVGTQSFSVLPGIRGANGSSTLLYRFDERTVTCGTTELLFEWFTASLTVRLTDQYGVGIPASTYTPPGPSADITTGDTVTLPITDESVYPTMNGAFKNGYYTGLTPGLEGRPGSSTELYRFGEELLELSPAPDGFVFEFVFEWFTSTLTVRLEDQHGVDIPASRFSVTRSDVIHNAGDSVTLPITDESVYPSMGGFYRDGYFTALKPGLAGNPQDGTWLGRYEYNLELHNAPAEFTFEWIQHSCPLAVRNAGNTAVPGSDLVLPPLFPDYVPGQSVAFPVNDAATYPSIRGYYASTEVGYWITVTPGDIAPASSEIHFTVNAAGEFTPATFAIGGNAYSLTCNSCATDTTPPVITCAPDLVIVSDRAACGEHDHDDDHWDHHRTDGRHRDDHEDHSQCRGHHGDDDHDAHGYTCLFWNRCVATGVTLSPPTVTDNCTVASITHNHPSTTYPLGESLVTWTATDAAGNTSTCIQKVTVLPSVEISFRSPLVRKPTHNTIRRGQVVPFKVDLKDCLGRTLRNGVTVKLQVQGIDSTTGDVFQDVIEDSNGLGTDGTITSDGLMQYRNSQWQFNLDTGNFGDPNTVAGSRYYRATVTVVDNATLAVLGLSTLNLETGRR